MEIEQILTFEVNSQLYGIDLLSLEEVLPILEVQVIPKSPGLLAGVINVRGKIIPVMDLRSELGQVSCDYINETKIILYKVDDDFIALIVDNILGIHKVPADSIDYFVNEKLKGNLSSGMVKLQCGKTIQLLKIYHFISEKQLKEIMHFAAKSDNQSLQEIKKNDNNKIK
ncbi:MAG: chemotaxis protein CheW [Bacteriovoracaceae bacterium]|nr:chemotaxis protein CheW [Bacteriovoracaceae bacterium]